jgi:polar amino acid transport system substrate-binding protein
LNYFKIILIATVFIAFNGEAKNKTFHLVAGVYPPYTIDGREASGLNIDIIRAAFSAVDYQVTIELLPFTRAMHYAKGGRADGLILWHNVAREQWFNFSSVISQSELVFYKKKSLEFEYKSLQSLIPFTIGTVANYGYLPQFLTAKNLTKEVVGTDKQNISKLVFGRINLALIDKRVANYLIEINHPKFVGKLDWSGVLQKESYYLAVSKQSTNYQNKINDFNLGLDIITQNGTREAIINKYDAYL